jgi:FtsP/CotA-like multicopper oxidase with cupredoxin domain
VNNIVGPGGTTPVLQGLIAVDQTVHWADPLQQHALTPMTPYAGPVPAVAHLHGGEVPSAFDGWDLTRGGHPARLIGAPASCPTHTPTRTLRNPRRSGIHDHALGATRLNVYAGSRASILLGSREGAGEAARRRADPAVDTYGNPYEREIVIQDRMFDTNGQLYWPAVGINPAVHPFWVPEFFGDIIMVNGKTWPYLQVEPRRYRLPPAGRIERSLLRPQVHRQPRCGGSRLLADRLGRRPAGPPRASVRIRRAAADSSS